MAGRKKYCEIITVGGGRTFVAFVGKIYTSISLSFIKQCRDCYPQSYVLGTICDHWPHR